MGERALEAALVRDQDADRDLVRNPRGDQHLLRVRQLRDHVGSHKAGDLEPMEPGASELLDEADLVGGRYHLRLVLEAVAGSSLTDPNARVHAAHPNYL